MLRNHIRRVMTAIGLVAVVGVLAAMPATAAPTKKAPPSQGNTQVITNADVARQPEDTQPTQNWVLYTGAPSSHHTAGVGTFVNGPGTPPLGSGSLQLSTPQPTDQVSLFDFQYQGTSLGDITDLGYSTYRESGTDQQDAALDVVIDSNGPDVAGGYDTLVFEPVYNTAQHSSVVNGTWQTWDAYNGRWWSTHDIPGVCASTCYVTWNQIVEANPNATVTAIGVNQGASNAGLITDVDALKIGTTTAGTTTYDFERGPITKDDCKNGGWQNYTNPSYKNQGQCVSSVASGK